MIRKRLLIMLGASLIFLMIFAGPSFAIYLTGYEGASSFGLGSPGCPLCDSTVNFAVWKNTDGNWFDDLDPGGKRQGLYGGMSDGTEQFVYLYQVINTDLLNVANPQLVNFNVSYGPIGTPNPFLVGGYFGNTTFAALDTSAPLDTPNDGTPGVVKTVTPLVDPVGIANPETLTEIICANPAVASGLGYNCMNYDFEGPTSPIGPGETSPVLFLTSNLGPTYSWAETESPGGFGAAGDVPSPVIPEPTTMLLFGSGLIGLAGLRRRFKN